MTHDALIWIILVGGLAVLGLLAMLIWQMDAAEREQRQAYRRAILGDDDE